MGIQAAQRREEERWARARPKQRSQPQPRQLEQGPWTTYHGMDDTCPICLEEFKRGDWVYRLSCDHLAHTECHQHLRATSSRRQEQPCCVCCRILAIIKAQFRHLGVVTTDPPSTDISRHAENSALPTQSSLTGATGVPCSAIFSNLLRRLSRKSGITTPIAVQCFHSSLGI